MNVLQKLEQDKHSLQECIECLIETEMQPQATTEESNLASLALFEIYDKGLVEHCLKSFVRNYKHDYQKLGRLIDLALFLSSSSTLLARSVVLLDESMPLLLLEELVDVSPTSEFKAIFSLLESRQMALLHNLLPNRGRSLVLLRLTNEMFRRLSKAPESSFLCGQMLLFLTAHFPLSERSALNLKGNFHTDNDIHIDPPLPTEEGCVLPTDLFFSTFEADTFLVRLKKELSEGTLIAYPFYRSFWDIIALCANPFPLTNSPSSASSDCWSLFTKKMDMLFFIFENLSDTESKSLHFSDSSLFASPKFMSSWILFRYQITDLFFKLRVTFQWAFLFMHLHESFQSNEKEAAKFEGCLSYWNRCLKLMDRYYSKLLMNGIDKSVMMPPPSSFIQLIRSEEIKWIQWKKNACPSFKLSEDSSIVPLEDIHYDSLDIPDFFSPDYSSSLDTALQEYQLKQTSIDISKLQRNNNHIFPALIDFLRPLKDQLDPSEGIEKEYRLDSDPVFSWKAMRLITFSRMDLYKQFRDGQELEQLALDLA